MAGFQVLLLIKLDFWLVDLITRFWDVIKGDVVAKLEEHKSNLASVAFDNNGLLATGSWDNAIRIWKVSTGECLKILQRHIGSVCSVAFDKNRLLASGSCDKL